MFNLLLPFNLFLVRGFTLCTGFSQCMCIYIVHNVYLQSGDDYGQRVRLVEEKSCSPETRQLAMAAEGKDLVISCS